MNSLTLTLPGQTELSHHSSNSCRYSVARKNIINKDSEFLFYSLIFHLYDNDLKRKIVFKTYTILP